jgi:quinoprotein glucose dehydrogenase
VVWAFQAEHHNLWDYDLPSGPSLIEVQHDGKRIAALAQATKMGHLFILDRDTGQPVLPVEERTVAQDGVAGEWLSATQPFPVKTPRLVPDRLEPRDDWGVTPWDRGQCRDTIASLRRGSIFTPPTLKASLQYPGNAGGTNWGGVSFDRARGLIVVSQTNLAFIVQLIPRAEVTDRRRHSGGEEGGWEYAPMKGTPYIMRRRALLST